MTSIRRRQLAWTVVGGSLLGALGVAVLILNIAPEAESPTDRAQAQEPKATPPAKTEAAPSPAPPAAQLALALAPANVIGNYDCGIAVGRGAAAGLAVVSVPVEGGGAFAVLNEYGEVFSGLLPFKPNHRRVGRQADGAVVAALGDLRWNSEVFRERNSPEPVRVFVDGLLTHQAEKALEFGVAPNGESFYLHEPLGEAHTRLVVRDLVFGEETHHDFGARFAPTNDYEVKFAPRYSNDGLEVMFTPAGPDSFGVGSHLFVPVRGEGMRNVRVLSEGEAPGGGGEASVDVREVYSAVFASSETGYFAHPASSPASDGRRRWRLARRDFDYEAGTAAEVWSRQLALRFFNGHMTLSDDGRWLALGAWNLLVVDTRTGGTALSYPKAGEKQKELEWLGNVMPSGSTVADLGSVTNWRFNGDRIGLLRSIGAQSTQECDYRAGRRQYYACRAELRRSGRYRTVYDVFALGAPVDAQPLYRVEANPDVPCGHAHFAFRLRSQKGRLAFKATAPAVGDGRIL